MGLVFDEDVWAQYKAWHDSKQGRVISAAMEEFLVRLLQPRAGERVLEVGCGLGETLLLLERLGVHTAGIEPSSYALSVAKKRVGRRCLLKEARAEDLPFEDNEFDAVLLFNTIEFVEDPATAISEAARVASKRVVVACVNRWSFGSLGNWTRAFFGNRVCSAMRPLSLWRLRALTREVCGPTPIVWASIRGPLPIPGHRAWPLAARKGVGACPFGLMIGISASLVYRLRAEPLPLQVRLKSAGHTAG